MLHLGRMFVGGVQCDTESRSKAAVKFRLRHGLCMTRLCVMKHLCGESRGDDHV